MDAKTGLPADGAIDTLDRRNEKHVRDWGYGLVYPTSLDAGACNLSINGESRTLQASGEAFSITIPGVDPAAHVLRKLPALKNRASIVAMNVPNAYVGYFGVNGYFAAAAELLARTDVNSQVTWCVDAKYVGRARYQLFPQEAGVSSLSAQWISQKPYEIRTAGQLASISGSAALFTPGERVQRTTQYFTDCRFAQTHNIAWSGGMFASLGSEFQPFRGSFRGSDGGVRHSIAGLNAPLFGTVGKEGEVTQTLLSGSEVAALRNKAALDNRGTIDGCTVAKSYLTGGDGVNSTAAGFVRENSGTVEQCAVSFCNIDSGDGKNSHAAGFAEINTGTMRKNAVKSCTMTGGAKKNAGDAAGFFYANESTGTAEGCAVLDSTITAPSGTAAGFVVRNDGRLLGCTADNNQVSGGRSFAFAAGGGGTAAAAQTGGGAA